MQIRASQTGKAIAWQLARYAHLGLGVLAIAFGLFACQVILAALFL